MPAARIREFTNEDVDGHKQNPGDFYRTELGQKNQKQYDIIFKLAEKMINPSHMQPMVLVYKPDHKWVTFAGQFCC